MFHFNFRVPKKQKTCKCDLKSTNKLEDIANDRDKWRSFTYRRLKIREKAIFQETQVE